MREQIIYCPNIACKTLLARNLNVLVRPDPENVVMEIKCPKCNKIAQIGVDFKVREKETDIRVR